jgi:ribosome-binding protein aMBF1 (putative translation factor)
MDRCYFTGISIEQEPLFDVIYEGNIVKACKAAVDDLGLMILKRPKVFDVEDINKRQSVYERLSRMSGMDKEFLKQKRPDNEEVRKELLNRQKGVTLRDIVEKKYKEEHKDVVIEKREDLVENFHWIIMRARRMKKVTQEQMAKEIGVGLNELRDAEKGIMRKDDSFVYKLEKYLGIQLFKDVKPKKEQPEVINRSYDINPGSKDLTISQLKELSEQYKDKRMKASYEGNPYEIEEDIEEEVVLNEEKMAANEQIGNFGKSKSDISDKELRELIFKRKGENK